MLLNTFACLYAFRGPRAESSVSKIFWRREPAFAFLHAPALHPMPVEAFFNMQRYYFLRTHLLFFFHFCEFANLSAFFLWKRRGVWKKTVSLRDYLRE
jgi:hypothetical protein